MRACGCVCVHTQSIDPRIRVIGAEPAACDDAARSLAAGSVQGNDAPFVTVADGLRTTLGTNTWPVVRDMVDAIVVVSEEEIVAGMKLIWQRMKLVRRVSGAGTRMQVRHAAAPSVAHAVTAYPVHQTPARHTGTPRLLTDRLPEVYGFPAPVH